MRRTTWAIVLIGAFLSQGRVAGQSAPAARPSTFTLEQVLSAPFPTELTASPSGDAAAWVFNDRGRRSVWIAEAPAYAGKALVTYTEDDGQDLTELNWAPDGQALVYVRGGGPNRRGEIPNPTSAATAAEQAIWVVSRTGGDPRRLGTGSQVAVSPKGDRVAWVSRGQLWSAALTGEARPAQLATLRGNAGSPRWSPDGTRLAFESSRETHGFIGVLDIPAKTTTFLDPSVDSDHEPAWSPDGKQVLFLREPVNRDRLPFLPVREAEPWSIRIADATTGAGREVWRAPPGRGSAFHPVVARQQVFWADGDVVVFPWEREGWVLLYAVPVRGGTPRLLTPGNFEVEYVTLAPDRRAMVFNSNQDDIDRRHLWRVPVAGGAPTPLTSGASIEWQPAVLGNGRTLAYLRSDARKPAQPWIAVDGGEPRELAPGSLPGDFPSAALVTPEPVMVSASDGMMLHGQLFKPAGLTPGERRAAVIFFHGGSRRQMLLGWNYGSYYHNAYALNQYLASRGFLVLSLNYRSGIGYGLDFREAIAYGPDGASEFNDVLGAGLYLRGRPDVDPARIGLWGGSYGGYLTAMGLSRASDLFAAGVDFHGVHDWNVV